MLARPRMVWRGVIRSADKAILDGMSGTVATLADQFRQRARPQRGGVTRAAQGALHALGVVGAVAGCTALIAVLRLPLPRVHLAILYLLPVLAVASAWGRRPGRIKRW